MQPTFAGSRTRSGRQYNKGLALAARDSVIRTTHPSPGLADCQLQVHRHKVDETGLEDLPYDVFLKVAGHLDARSWLNARLACRAWHALFSTLPYRVKIHGGKKATDHQIQFEVQPLVRSVSLQAAPIAVGRLYKAGKTVVSAFPKLAHASVLLPYQKTLVDLSGDGEATSSKYINAVQGIVRELAALAHLRSLRLIQRIAAASVAAVAQLTSLEVLDLSECLMASADLPVLCQGLSNLKELRLPSTSQSRTAFKPRDLQALSQLPHLNSLVLGVNISFTGEQLVALCSVTQLAVLKLVPTGPFLHSEHGVVRPEELMALSNLVKLEVLHSPFFACGQQPWGEMPKFPRAQPRLKYWEAWRQVTAACELLREVKWHLRGDWSHDVLRAIAAPMLHTLVVTAPNFSNGDPTKLSELIRTYMDQLTIIQRIIIEVGKYNCCIWSLPLLQMSNVELKPSRMDTWGNALKPPQGNTTAPCARAGLCCFHCEQGFHEFDDQGGDDGDMEVQ